MVILHSLGLEQIKVIIDIQLERLKKLLSEKKLTLELTEAAKERLATAGYDPHFGARPLKRAIQHEVRDPLAMEILAGKFSEGDVVVADLSKGKGEKLIFTKK